MDWEDAECLIPPIEEVKEENLTALHRFERAYLKKPASFIVLSKYHFISRIGGLC